MITIVNINFYEYDKRIKKESYVFFFIEVGGNVTFLWNYSKEKSFALTISK